MKQSKSYMTPEAEQIIIRFEQNVLSNPNGGENEGVGENPDGPSF